MADSKVKIELTPYNSLTILSFLREFVKGDCEHNYELKSLYEAVDEFEKELSQKITDAQFEEADRENAINQLIGKSPIRDGMN